MKKILGISASGFLLALVLPLELGEDAKLYLSICILVALASLLKLIIEILEFRVDYRKWLIEISSNLLLSTFLVYLSLGLKIPLYYAVIIYFGLEIFENTSQIRYFLLND